MVKKTLPLISFLILLLPLARAPVRATAQSQQQPVEHFAKDGLSFDYPAGWKLADRSNEAAQHLILSREGSSALVMVIAYRDRVANSRQFEIARDSITTPYVENLARSLGVEKAPSWDDVRCLDLGEKLPTAMRFATGFSLSGRSNGQPATGEVYVIGLNQRFVNLVYVRNDKDDADGARAWKNVLETLKVDAPKAPAGDTAGAPAANIISGGVLNGKAVKKPQPEYPAIAKAAHEQGVVTVQIVVDEEGNVVSAKAVSGPTLLKSAGEKAARQAKFTPTTVCGHPVKVSGVITYNFVLQFGVKRL
jgi:TonB family protein